MILAKVKVRDGSTAVDAAAPVAGSKWVVVGDAELAVVNVRVSGTMSETWEFYTRCDTKTGDDSFIALDVTHNASGLQTTAQGTNGSILAFDTRGVDAVYLRPVTRTAGDESMDAMITLYRGDKP